MVPDTVLGKVASLAALELLSEPIGDAAIALALSSHVSHAASVLTLAMLGALWVLAAFLCPRMLGLFLGVGTALTPCSDQNPGSARSGRAPCVTLFVCRVKLILSTTL